MVVADVNARVWRPDAASPLAAGAEAMARQAASFLAASAHDEIDGARVDTTHALTTADGSHVYAGAVVHGPLRAYLATVSGPAGRAAHKYIVSYPDAASAQAALDAALARQQAQGYASIGTVDAEA